MPSELAEELEDSLAVVLECMGFHGHIDDDTTGNTTVFPNEQIRGNLHLLYLLREHLATRPDEIICSVCGSNEISTSEDDDELRECNECGHAWEIDNDS